MSSNQSVHVVEKVVLKETRFDILITLHVQIPCETYLPSRIHRDWIGAATMKSLPYFL